MRSRVVDVEQVIFIRVEVRKHAKRKKEIRPISSLVARHVWSTSDVVSRTAWKTTGSPEQRLARSVSQSLHRVLFILLAALFRLAGQKTRLTTGQNPRELKVGTFSQRTEACSSDMGLYTVDH